MNSYRILIIGDDQLLESFEAKNDFDAFDTLRVLAQIFNDDLSNYKLFKEIEV